MTDVLPAKRRSHRVTIVSNTGDVSAIELLIAASTSPEARLLVERFLGLVEKPHVLECDRRLITEGVQQRDFALAGTPALAAGEAGSHRTAVLRAAAATR